jgi:predicted nucleic acid-binding Zn ribbon protein
MNVFEHEEVYDEFEVPTVPRANVRFPPPEGYDGVQHPVECVNPECGYIGDMGVEFGKDIEGTCPDCGGELRKDFSRHMWGIDSRGAGFHGTKIGDRIKRDRIKRSEKLAQTQWEQHDYRTAVQNPDRVLNGTEGGPYDPNSKFNRHRKKNTRIVYPR